MYNNREVLCPRSSTGVRDHYIASNDKLYIYIYASNDSGILYIYIYIYNNNRCSTGVRE